MLIIEITIIRIFILMIIIVLVAEFPDYFNAVFYRSLLSSLVEQFLLLSPRISVTNEYSLGAPQAPFPGTQGVQEAAVKLWLTI